VIDLKRDTDTEDTRGMEHIFSLFSTNNDEGSDGL